MTGKTTNLILLGGALGVLLGGLLGYIMPNYAPATDFVGKLIFSALNGIISCVIVGVAIFVALTARGESSKLSTTGAKPFSYLLAAVFIGVTVASVAAASARPETWTSSVGTMLPNALVLTLAFGATLLGGLISAVGATVAASASAGAETSSASRSDQRYSGRYDRSHGRQYGSGRSEHREGHGDQHRGGDRQQRSGQERGGRGGHDRGGYRRERPNDRQRDSDRTSPFTVSTPSAPSFDTESSETTLTSGGEQTKPESRTESRPESRPDSRSESDRPRDSRGRNYGGGRGRDRDRERGPRQYRDRDRRDHRSGRHSGGAGEETSEREMREEPAAGGNITAPTPEPSTETAREQSQVFETPRPAEVSGDSPARHEQEPAHESSSDDNQVAYGRSRHHHMERHQPNSESGEAEHSEPEQVPDAVPTGPLEFGRSRRKRTR